jgi:hypothetical protein
MLPGFTAPTTDGGSSIHQGVMPAGLWDNPTGSKGETCVYSHTTTSCIAVSLWCTEHYRCPNNPDSTKTPYPCGVCVGFDW